MPRVKKSARILELTGAYKKHPERKNKDEPEVRGLTSKDVPKDLSSHEKKVFKRLVGYMPPGVYTVAEIPLLSLVARLQSEMEINYEEFTAAKMGHLMKGIIQLGMTPGERSKLVQPKAPTKGKFED